MIEIVYKTTDQVLTIPKGLLPPDGVPFSHHFQSTPSDNLIELAGRTCYDSSKNEKTRGSADYHNHINEVDHSSTQAHVNITVEFNTDNTYINSRGIILISCLNRPGVFVRESNGNIRITANIRAIRQWSKWHNNLIEHKVQMAVGASLIHWAKTIAPRAMSGLNLPYLVAIYPTKLVSPEIPEENWLSFYVSGVSRGLTHELVRHGYRTAISQRSTRYVDESESEWAWHPLLKKYESKMRSMFASKYGFSVVGPDLCYPSDVEAQAKQVYEDTVNCLQEILISENVDKFSARKQARGAARGILGNALSTELIWSASLDQIKRVISQRANAGADGEIREFGWELYQLVEPLDPEFFKATITECQDGIGKHITFKEGNECETH